MKSFFKNALNKLNMKAMLKPLAATTAAGVLLSDLSPETSKFFWGFGSRKKNSTEKTATFIWGNGYYQSQPGKSMQFTNFTPKRIRTFNGINKPFLKYTTLIAYQEGVFWESI